MKKSKITYQINKLSEKSDSKSKSLKMRQKEMKKKMKITSSWWEKKVIYNLKLIAWWLASMKVSEKHQESEKSKKD